MSKHFSKQFSKNKLIKSDTRFRESFPKVNETKAGVQLLCPFCVPTHPIVPNQPTPCGTTLKVTAVQMIYTKDTVKEKGLVCSKCKQGGGEMIQYMNVYAHLPDCKPDTFLLPQLPEFSKLAGLVYCMKNEKLKNALEKRWGLAQVVKDITAEGQETGVVLGYFFMKKPGYGYPEIKTEAQA